MSMAYHIMNEKKNDNAICPKCHRLLKTNKNGVWTCPNCSIKVTRDKTGRYRSLENK